MKPVVYCYAKCSTCKKALNWLTSNSIEADSRSITEETPNAEQIRQWHEMSELPLRRFFNTSGMKYRELKLSEKLSQMSEQEQYELLASDGMLIKRPLLIAGDIVLLGFKEKDWEEALL